MDAWILHIREEWLNSEQKLAHEDRYSAWMSEKQALGQAAEWLSSQIKYDTSFQRHIALRNALRCLIADHHIEEAIALTNRYTSPEANFSGHHHVITITKSTFQGSPFE